MKCRHPGRPPAQTYLRHQYFNLTKQSHDLLCTEPLLRHDQLLSKLIFSQSLVQKSQVRSIAAGLLFQLHLYDDTLIAFLGFDSLKFTKPVKPGDTIHARIKVLEKRETSNPERGVMKRQLQVLNQRGEVVKEGLQAFLLKHKPAS